jgi:hypothetical protein
MSLASRFKLAAGAAVLAAALCGSWAGSAQAAIPSPNAATWRFCSNCVESGGDLSRFAFVGLNAWFHDRIPAMKARNPSAKALVYKDMASTRSWSCGGLIPTGVDYCWAEANHPEWFTLDGRGRRIEWAGYPGVWQMDVGTPAYQEEWAANVIAELRANGWDGVVIDNANVDESPYLGGRTMWEYPTQASYQAATRSFLARVCPEVIAAGFLCLPNIQAHRVLANDDLWADWVQFTSGGTREYWMKWGTGTSGRFGGPGWSDLVRVFERVQVAGKIFLPSTYAPLTDIASIRYARASFLLAWDGGPSASIVAPTPEATDPWSEEATVEIGKAAGRRYFACGVWQRDFEAGKVVVNPSTSLRHVPLGGTYELPGGSRVSELDLAPRSGAVLRTPEPDVSFNPWSWFEWLDAEILDALLPSGTVVRVRHEWHAEPCI